ncbi:MAG TPA: hypothetical protein ENN63_09905 [Bacteroidetes bacterium]|nr:hypothetical protein [Bacteroidota bacterium]
MKDALSSESCWFSHVDRRNEDPLQRHLHQATGIAGGTGPTGSIRARSKQVLIPRCRFASRVHKTGTILRVAFLCIAVFWLIMDLLADNAESGIVAFLLIIVAGSLLMHFLYRLAGVRSKASVYRKHPQIRSLIREGYRPGSHPVFSTTPFGWIWMAMKRTLI